MTPFLLPLLGRNFSYDYDNLGNRTSASVDAVSAAYTPDNVNQYSDRAVPGAARIAGLAPADAAIAVNGSTTGISRQGDYYYQSLPVTNTSAVSPAITIASSYGGGGTRHAFFPATPEVFTYDDDGNLIRDGRWVYQYDAENRLVVMFTRGAPEDPLSSDPTNTAVWNSGVARQRIEYTYDYMGRRVRKSVFNRSGSAWATTSDTKFIYDGWNLIAEYAVSGGTLSLNRSHTWGLDWSGSRQGAGGVGGLLQTANYAGGSARYLPAYDGNGNVSAMVDQGDGTIAAAFEYSAFGELLRATGPAQDKCLFRFSTKYTDAETGLVYYGQRYYSSAMGRFINRDPIGEQGGLNLYGFVGNNAVNHVDYLGNLMIPQKICESVSWGEPFPYNGPPNCHYVYMYIPDPAPPGGSTSNPSGGTTSGSSGGGTSGGNSGNGNGNPNTPVDPNKADNAKPCAKLAQQLAANQWSRDSMLADFDKGGLFQDQRSLLGVDKLSAGQILTGAAVDYNAARVELQAARGIPMGGNLTVEFTRYPTGAANTLGKLSKGVAVVGIGIFAYQTVDSAIEGDGYGTANGALNTGAAIYALTGPIGWAVGAGQGVIGLAQIGWTTYWNGVANDSTAAAAQNVRGMIVSTNARIDGINQQRAALGCK